MTKVSIISGFLGAGKTTFIKKLLEEVYKNQKIVLIENEFGEIGIDGGFLKDAGVQINEMNSGCICCSLVGDFGEALKKVASEYTPDLIIIEPSGVGKLSDVIAAVENVKEEAGLELDSFITVSCVSEEYIGFVLSKLSDISSRFNVNFTISISVDADRLPDEFKENIIISL